MRDVHVAYGAVTALRGISLEVREKEIVCLLGANGAGKSTTLRTVSGLLHPLKGEVLLDGKPIHGLSPVAIARRGISDVPEGRRVFPGLTVRENLVLGTSNRPNVRREEMEADMARMFKLFPDLERLKSAPGWTLSGGQQQMLAIARGLMARPQILLMDEPSLGLAPILVQEVFRVIKEINTSGTTILLVEQNASMALAISHRGYVMETGRIVLEGTAQDLLQNPQVRDAYLGGGKGA
ncbi:MAG: ABC transporter ATP-binding protein [candidate division NC10 bacterium]|nr:ABC transporter ATP-binding protein [candidate division NC10 bacterium]